MALPPVVNWEPLFRLLSSGEIFPVLSRPRRRSLVNWSQVVEEWRGILPSLVNGPVTVMIGFDLPVHLPGNAQYYLVWDIEKAQKLLTAYRITKEYLPVDQLYAIARADEPNSDDLAIPGPILVAHTPIFSPPITLIDGNHRVVAAYQENAEQYVPVCILPEDVMLQAMAAEAFRTFYQWHQSIQQWLELETRDAEPQAVPIPKRFQYR